LVESSANRSVGLDRYRAKAADQFDKLRMIQRLQRGAIHLQKASGSFDDMPRTETHFPTSHHRGLNLVRREESSNGETVTSRRHRPYMP
jgi:hypothetical protein